MRRECSSKSRWQVTNPAITILFAFAWVPLATPATIIDLGTLNPYGINAAGQIVGYAATGSGINSPIHAFLYSDGILTDLGTLGGSNSYAYAINNAGQVVGMSDTKGGTTQHSFLYSGRSMTDLGTLGTVNALSVARSINASGQVAGYSYLTNSLGSGDVHAFLYSSGVMTDLGTLGGPNRTSQAYGINDAGQVVGGSNATANSNDAFLYAGGTVTDLGTLGGSISWAYGINAAGQVVGTSTKVRFTPDLSPIYTYAFLYSGGKMINLGTLGGLANSYAYGINAVGQIVGTASTDSLAAVRVTRAFWYSGGTMTDLNSLLPANSRWQLTGATAINDSGQIVGSGTINGQGHGFLLELAPPNQSQTITFEPLTAVSFGVAPFTISAMTSSGLTVSFASTTPAVCTLAGTTVTIVAAGTCSITASQAGNANYSTATPVTQSFTVTNLGGGPAITPGSIGPVSSSSTTIQPGSWISIYGNNLATITTSSIGDFPTSLGGVSVTINGKKAYLSYVSPTQINLQAPDDTTTGKVSVVVTNANGSSTSNVTLGQFGPSFILLDGKHVAAIILRSDGSGAYGGGSYDITGPTGTSLGYKTVAATQGDVVELFGVGFGPTNPHVPAGQVFSGAAATTNTMQIIVGGVTLTPLFAGLSSAGLYQVNLTIPAGLPPGDKSLVAIVGGVQTQSGVMISIQ